MKCAQQAIVILPWKPLKLKVKANKAKANKVQTGFY